MRGPNNPSCELFRGPADGERSGYTRVGLVLPPNIEVSEPQRLDESTTQIVVSSTKGWRAIDYSQDTCLALPKPSSSDCFLIYTYDLVALLRQTLAKEQVVFRAAENGGRTQGDPYHFLIQLHDWNTASIAVSEIARILHLYRLNGEIRIQLVDDMVCGVSG